MADGSNSTTTPSYKQPDEALAPTALVADTLRVVLAPIAQDRCFLCWQPVPRGNRVEKVPCDPESGRIPKSGNSAAQRATLDLDEALVAAEKHGCGVGLVPGKATSAKVIGLDFDDALSTTGAFRASLAQIAGAPDVYLEVSPSGSGQMQPTVMNELIQQNLAEIGIKVEFDVRDWNALLANWRAGAKDPGTEGAASTRSASRTEPDARLAPLSSC